MPDDRKPPSFWDRVKQAPLWVKIVVPVVLLIAVIAVIPAPEDNGDGDGEEATTTAAEEATTVATEEATQSDPRSWWPTPPDQCTGKTPDPGSVHREDLCRIAREQFGDKLIDAVAIKNPEQEVWGISFDFRRELDETAELTRKKIELEMVEAYFAVYESSLGDQFGWISIAAYLPGDEPFVDFPLYHTSVGAKDARANPAADPATYWTVHLLRPALR
jgi:hypothetical protein